MITIHVGLHKTGSSSIQLALGLIRGQKRRLIITPDSKDDRTEQGWCDRLRAVAHSPDSIFSDENLLGTPDNCYQVAPERLTLIKTALSHVPYQLVVYLRPQPDWLPSVYLQGVQEGRTTTVRDFWAGVKDQPFLNWSDLLSLLGQESGAEKVIVRAHTRSRDAVADFFDTCGLGKPPRTGKTMIRVNSSIADVQAPVLMALNALPNISADQRRHLRYVFQQVLAPGAAAGYSVFPESIQQEIAQRFRDDWRLVGDMLASADPREAQAFRDESARWMEPAHLFGGASLSDPLIQEEALRSLLTLALSQDVTWPKPLMRLASKLHGDPAGVIPAIYRYLWQLR